MSESQLTIYGAEVPVEAVGNHRSLTPAQRAIVREVYARGAIRPVDAGRIVHGFRGCPPFPKPRHYSSDGVACLKRLEKRGLVVHESRGRWCRTVESL